MRQAANVCFVLFVLGALLVLQRPTATAQPVSRPADSGFSFAVYGDFAIDDVPSVQKGTGGGCSPANG